MSTLATPLARHSSFRTTSSEALSSVLEDQLGARIATLPSHDGPLSATASRVPLALGELWFCSYGTAISVQFPDADCIRIQFQHAGCGATRVGRERIGVTDRQACISRGAVGIDFGPHFQQLVWRVPCDVLKRQHELLHESGANCSLDFVPTIDLDRPEAITLHHLMKAMTQAADWTGDESRRVVLTELEQAFATSLLAFGGYRFDGATAPSDGAAPWQVHRAEAYIEANWDKPLTIEGLVAATGVSARTLFRTFKQSRECTPMEFARRIRLAKARTMLADPNDGKSVTEIAYACGFGDLSRFAKHFAQAFGETPSTLLRRSRCPAAAS